MSEKKGPVEEYPVPKHLDKHFTTGAMPRSPIVPHAFLGTGIKPGDGRLVGYAHDEQHISVEIELSNRQLQQLNCGRGLEAGGRAEHCGKEMLVLLVIVPPDVIDFEDV